MHEAAATLPDDIEALKAMLLAERVSKTAQVAELSQRNERLERLIAEFKRALFGKRSEKLEPDQMELALEDIETALTACEAETEASGRDSTGKKRKANRGALPKHLPRTEVVIEPDSTVCPCGCGEMHVIGEDVSERLDVTPARFRVIVTRRPKYACRICQDGVRAGPGARPADCRWHSHRGVGWPCAGE